MLQVFKFAIYVSIPIVMTALIAGNPDTLEAIIKNVSKSNVLARTLQTCILKCIGVELT
jgi:hypothetical protein